MIRLCLFVLLSSTTWAQTLTFDRAVQDALRNNIGLQIIQNSRRIRDAQIVEATADYYPTLSLDFTTQYTESLRDKESDSSKTPKETLPEARTGYESSLTFNLDYTLFDFGARAARRGIALTERKQVDVELEQSRQDLKLKLLELYAQILAQKQRQIRYQAIYKLQQKVLAAKKRLLEAGEIDRVAVSTQVVITADARREVRAIRAKLKQLIRSLNYQTGQTFTSRTHFASLYTRHGGHIRFEQTPQYKKWLLAKEKKRQEIDQVRAERLPRIDLFGNYNLRGFARCRAECALDDLQPHSYAVGVRVRMTLFDGFKRSAQQERLRAELMEIQLRQEQARREFEQQQIETQQNIMSLDEEIGLRSRVLRDQRRKLTMHTRLSRSGETSALRALEDRIDLEYKKLDFALRRIERDMQRKQQEIFNAR